jgi:hypothetical protein
MSAPKRPGWATHTEQRDSRTWHTKEVGQVDLADGASAIIVRVAQIVWTPVKPLGAERTVATESPVFVDIRRAVDGKPNPEPGAMSPEAASELAGLLREASRLARHFTGGTR